MIHLVVKGHSQEKGIELNDFFLMVKHTLICV